MEIKQTNTSTLQKAWLDWKVLSKKDKVFSLYCLVFQLFLAILGVYVAVTGVKLFVNAELTDGEKGIALMLGGLAFLYVSRYIKPSMFKGNKGKQGE